MATGGTTIKTLPRELTLEFIKKITDDFSEQQLIGTGIFGSVYKGTLDSGEIIAVKKLAPNSPVPRDQVFANEVQNIMLLKHENIVKLVAFCREGHDRLVQINGRDVIAEITETLLCYEYLPMGSLDKKLFGGSSILNWATRFKIIKGICKGIHCIHNLPSPIVHLDLKPQNILLDKNMEPKISDFGFSRIFGPEQSRMKTKSAVGSVGYIAPEYLYNGEISAHSDIYSLGLVILEISTGEKNSSSTGQEHARNYIDEVRENWKEEQILSMYPEVGENELNQVEACIEIGLQCVEIDQIKRPSINNILRMLNGESF